MCVITTHKQTNKHAIKDWHHQCTCEECGGAGPGDQCADYKCLERICRPCLHPVYAFSGPCELILGRCLGSANWRQLLISPMAVSAGSDSASSTPGASAQVLPPHALCLRAPCVRLPCPWLRMLSRTVCPATQTKLTGRHKALGVRIF